MSDKTTPAPSQAWMEAERLAREALRDRDPVGLEEAMAVLWREASCAGGQQADAAPIGPPFCDSHFVTDGVIQMQSVDDVRRALLDNEGLVRLLRRQLAWLERVRSSDGDR